MKDYLKQYLQLRKTLIAEKQELETRLKEINAVLGGTPSPNGVAPRRGRPPGRKRGRPAKAAAKAAGKAGRRGRPPGKKGNKISLSRMIREATRAKALSKDEIVKLVQGSGYKFRTRNPMNSLNALLYSKKFKRQDGKFVAA